jgi:hypothetical protein
MILNKFRPFSLSGKLKALSLQLFALSLFSCNKTANINANKAFISLTHVAYGVDPLKIYFDGKLLFPSAIAFGQTTGTSDNPYDTATSRIGELFLGTPDSSTSKQGNASFLQQAHYSIFAFDSLNKNSFNLLILQDNVPIRTDTFTYIRYMNFSPGDSIWGLKLINNRKDFPYLADTVLIPSGSFVGFNINPSAYSFTQVRSGNYNVFAFRDSSNPAIDSSNFIRLGDLQIDSLVNYNIYLQGFLGMDTGVNKFQLKSVPLN